MRKIPALRLLLPPVPNCSFGAAPRQEVQDEVLQRRRGIPPEAGIPSARQRGGLRHRHQETEAQHHRQLPQLGRGREDLRQEGDRGKRMIQLFLECL